MTDIYVRLASGLGWTYPVIDEMSLPEVNAIFDYWRDWPPVNELVRNAVGYEKPLTMEEKIEQGAMGPLDFLHHYRKTQGKLQTH